LIALPLYRRPDLAVQVINSLIQCAHDIVTIRGEVVIYNDSPDDPGLGEVLERLLPLIRAALPCRLDCNPRNLGFVKTANRALEEGTQRGLDVLLLNSDTVVTPGALVEMVRVSRLDPMIGFVNPRSNNATLATLPYQDRFRHLPVKQARRAWEAIAFHLPEASYVPTAVGFCMLIRWSILAEFGGFDEIFDPGFNEENDLVMRAGRRGYRAVLANHAFVWHLGSGSFSCDHDASALEATHRAVLLARYPEYPGLTDAYFSSPEQRAEYLLGALIPDAEGRLDIAFDFSSFVAAYNGTFQAGAQLLAGAAIAWRDRFNLFILCSEQVYAFHDYARFNMERRDPHGGEAYAAIFRVGQPFEWGALTRLAHKALTFGVFMLDTIAMDCSQLAQPVLHDLWSFTAEHADMIATTSQSAADQLSRRVPFGPDTLHVKSLHSLDLADYRLPMDGVADDDLAPGYVFVVGNHYWHKDVARTVNALAEAYPRKTFVVLGGGDVVESQAADEGDHAPVGLQPFANVVHLPSGQLSRARLGALYRDAEVVVIPSHYEGFGMPVLNALAARRPVLVRPLPVFEEMEQALGGEANLHVFATTDDLVRQLAAPPVWTDEGASLGRPGDALRAARDIKAAIEASIARASYSRVVRRIRALRPTGDPQVRTETIIVRELYTPAPATPAAFVANFVGRGVERAIAVVLAAPGVFRLLRFTVRLLRWPTRAFRRAPPDVVETA